MLDLRAVYPNRVRIIDYHGEHFGCLPADRIDESRVETAAQGLAWFGKGSLRDVVLSRVEVKDEAVSYSSGRDIGSEREACDAGV